MPVGRLHGREDVLGVLTTALAHAGALTTLTGLPGSGRTALARAALSSVAGEGGFAVVEGRRSTGPRALAAELEACTAAHLLLLDDVDHAPGARRHVEDLRRSRPDCRVVLVSRTPLGIPGEVVVRVPPLPLPDPDDDPDRLRRAPAVALFLEVAGRTGAAVVEDRAVTAVARICRLLGGLPLAIELVAARTSAYSPGTLATLLEGAPAQLLGVRAGADERAREHDLLTAVSWSVDQLRPGERSLLADLAAFEEHVPLEVLLEVGDRSGLLDDLSALVDVHLVQPHHVDGTTRFSLPPLVRGHLDAAGLHPDGAVLQRHLSWAHRLAAEAVALEARGRFLHARRLAGPHEPDLRAALSRALRSGQADAAATLALAMAPLVFDRGATSGDIRAADAVLELVRGQRAADGGTRDTAETLLLAAWRELLRAEDAHSAADVGAAVRVLEELRERARAVDDEALLRVSYVAVQAARSLPERSAPEAWAREALELAERRGDLARTVRLQTWTGMLAHQRGEVTEAARWAWQALEHARRLDDPSLLLAPAGLLHGLPRAVDGQPRVPDRPVSDRPATDPLPTADQLVSLARECGDLRALDWLEPTAAFLALTRADLAGAVDHSAATLRRTRSTGALLRAGPPTLCLFLVALHLRDLTWAGRLHGVLGRYLDVLVPALPPAAAASYERAVAGYRAAVTGRPDAASDVLWGSRLSGQEAVEAALGYAGVARAGAEAAGLPAGVLEGPVSPAGPSGAARPQAPTGREEPITPARPGSGTLTDREQDVLTLLVGGGTNREISSRLGISAKTVMHHTSSIYRKLGVRGRAEAVAWSVRSGRAGAPDAADLSPRRLHLVEQEDREADL